MIVGQGMVTVGIGAEHGRLDGLLAAAGTNKEGNAVKYTAANFNSILRVNVTRVFSTVQAARGMAKHGNGGLIVLITSMSATIAGNVSPELLLPRFLDIIHC